MEGANIKLDNRIFLKNICGIQSVRLTNLHRGLSPRVVLEGLGYAFGPGQHRTRDSKESKQGEREMKL